MSPARSNNAERGGVHEDGASSPMLRDRLARAMRIGIRHKLIILSALVIVVVSTGLTWANLLLARRAIEEDFKSRAILYAREVAISIGDRAPLEPEPVLRRIGRLIELRRTVLQLDVHRLRSRGDHDGRREQPAGDAARLHPGQRRGGAGRPPGLALREGRRGRAPLGDPRPDHAGGPGRGGGGGEVLDAAGRRARRAHPLLGLRAHRAVGGPHEPAHERGHPPGRGPAAPALHGLGVARGRRRRSLAGLGRHGRRVRRARPALQRDGRAHRAVQRRAAHPDRRGHRRAGPPLPAGGAAQRAALRDAAPPRPRRAPRALRTRHGRGGARGGHAAPLGRRAPGAPPQGPAARRS